MVASLSMLLEEAAEVDKITYFSYRIHIFGPKFNMFIWDVKKVGKV